MSEPIAPPPPPAPPMAPAPAAKKGMSTGAKVAIGCLVIVALSISGCFIAGMFGLKWIGGKAKSFVEDAQKDPDAAAVKAVEILARLNPEVEVVSSDPAAGTITVREKHSGKVVTFRAEDVRDGRFSFESEDEKVSFDIRGAEGDEPGVLAVTSGQKKVVFGGSDEAIPDWVPRYEGAEESAYWREEAEDQLSGTFLIRTGDDASVVLESFEGALEGDGFEVEKSIVDAGEGWLGNLTASNDARQVNVTVSLQADETQVRVAYSEKKAD